MKRMLDIIVDECTEGIQETATGIQKGLAYIVETTSKVPGEMSKKFGKRLKDIVHTISNNFQKRDEIFFKQIADHKAVVLSLQSTNVESVKLLYEKVFSLSSSLSDFKGMVMQSMERIDNGMALVHHQREQANVRQQNARDDIAMSRSQM